MWKSENEQGKKIALTRGGQKIRGNYATNAKVGETFTEIEMFAS